MRLTDNPPPGGTAYAYLAMMAGIVDRTAPAPLDGQPSPKAIR
ncbi:hypothetical protein ABZ733_13325 [Streptomyces longwoodensis]